MQNDTATIPEPISDDKTLESGSQPVALGKSDVLPLGYRRNSRGLLVRTTIAFPRRCKKCGESAYPGQRMVSIARSVQAKFCPPCRKERILEERRTRVVADLGPKHLRDALEQPSRWAHLHRAVAKAPAEGALTGGLSPQFFPIREEWDEDIAK
jgi:hypothetical protein